MHDVRVVQGGEQNAFPFEAGDQIFISAKARQHLFHDDPAAKRRIVAEPNIAHGTLSDFFQWRVASDFCRLGAFASRRSVLCSALSGVFQNCHNACKYIKSPNWILSNLTFWQKTTM